MVNLHQRDKNAKHDSSLLPYAKDEIYGNENELEVKNPMDNVTRADEKAQSGSEFLLSIAGMFSSGTTDTSERVEELVAAALKKKYS